MSESATDNSEQDNVGKHMPSAVEAYADGIPSAWDIPLEDINPASPRLFGENRWQEYFERLRAEDPVHFNETEAAGRYWSLTRFNDIKAVDTDWKNFSSNAGITLGLPIGVDLPEGALQGITTFIAQDPPEHDSKRMTVTGSVAPPNLARMEPLIRERSRDGPDPFESRGDAGFSLKVAVKLLAILRQLCHVRRGTQLRNQTRGMPSGT